MKVLKTFNLEVEVAEWLKEKGNASETMNTLCKKEMGKKEKNEPEKSPYPYYSPRTSCWYVEERLKQLRSATKKKLIELMTSEVGLSRNKTQEFINVLISLNKVIIKIIDNTEYVVSLWSQTTGKYLPIELAEKLTAIEKDILNIDSTGGKDG
jgi:hypothetical protein